MLAVAVEAAPDGPDWAFEVKWDGIRAIVTLHRSSVGIAGRSGRALVGRFPELAGLRDALGDTDVVLDGEIVAFDDTGRPSFQRLQRRMHLSGRSAARRATEREPVTYLAFDLLWWDGTATIALPYRARRHLLDELGLYGSSWRTPPAEVGTSSTTLALTREFGLEGVVAKQFDSVYLPGQRSLSWRKVKHHRRQEFVVGGWVPGTGARRSTFGALLVGYFDETGGLRYAGRVGTGFRERELEELATSLLRLRRDGSPFVDVELPPDARFVEPTLVIEVRFAEWTGAGRLRHPSYVGRRADKRAHAVVREG